ncbi:hypothetical protein V6N11_021064 [Hibiscus sabdariffa]|uniref:Uncharacterized protein n=2 Tax=Hibiscus sabdariffa TaxID=183260 RepID=A0ABR1ZC05_9ROSI
MENWRCVEDSRSRTYSVLTILIKAKSYSTRCTSPPPGDLVRGAHKLSYEELCEKPWGAAAEDHATCRTRGQAGPEGPRHLQGARWRGPSGPARPRALQVARSSAAAPLGSAHSS